MKKYISIIIFTCAAVLMWSCEKELEHVNTVSTTDGLAFIKLVHASPNFRQIVKGKDSFNVYVNGVKINGAQLTYNAIFPTATNLYAAVPAGPQSIRITANGVTTPDSITFASLNKTLVPGGYYSFIMTDSLLTANEAKQMWIRDKFALTDTNNFTLRFVNAVLNDPAAVDIYSFKRATNIFTNVAPATATAFITLPYAFQTDTFYVRATGTLVDIAKVTVATGTTGANTINRSRPYTLLYKGAFGNTTKPRSLTLFAND